MLTIFDRLGGSPMRWTKLGGFGLDAARPSATKPVRHAGYHYSREIRFEQSLFTLCPSRADLRPSNVFLIELFQLAGPRQATDQVVGWAALPISDYHFNIVQGRFKLPLLRGGHSWRIDKHSDVERLLLSDLSHWLCNIYLEVRHLPRETKGRDGILHREFDIEFDHLNRQVRVGDADRQRRAREKRRLGERAKAFGMAANDEDDGGADGAAADDRMWPNRKGELFRTQAEERVAAPSARRRRSFTDMLRGVGGTPVFSMLREQSSRPLRWLGRGARTPRTAPAGAEGTGGAGEAKLADVESGRAREEGEGGGAALLEDGVESWRVEERGYDSEEEMYLEDEKKSRMSGAAELGLLSYGIRRRRGEGTRYDDGGLGISEGTSVETPKVRRFRWSRLVDAQEMEMFSAAVAPDPGRRSAELPGVIALSKLRYIKQEILADLAPHNYRSQDFWLTVWVYTMAMWIRMYVHYISQYLFLSAFNVPIFSFGPKLHLMVLKYIMTSIDASTEIGLVVVGPLGVLAVLLALMLLGAMSRRLLGGLPDWASKFCAAFGLGAVLDPLFVLLVDVLVQNFDCVEHRPECAEDYTSDACECFQGDAFKLYRRMEEAQNSGVTGVFITGIVYTITTAIAAFALYKYLLFIHLNGRMLDVHRRLHLCSSDIFVPHDFEMSVHELTFVCRKARKWQGHKGEQKKVYVSKYELTDPDRPSFRELTTHIAIYILALDGKRTLHRSFLRLASGLIIEIFDESVSDSLGSRYRDLDGLLGTHQADTERGARGPGGFFAGLAAPAAAASGRALAIVPEGAEEAEGAEGAEGAEDAEDARDAEDAKIPLA